MDITEDIDQDPYAFIEKAGADILSSYFFIRVAGQRHHIVSTVGFHSIHVALVMMRLSAVFKMDTVSVVRACLWHDVGIYDRDTFDHDMASEHPKRSLSIAEHCDDLNDTERDMISHHMWPMCLHKPHTREGFLITLADKWCAVTEFLGIKNKRIEEVLEDTGVQNSYPSEISGTKKYQDIDTGGRS